MSLLPEDRAFALYCADGSPQALAEVYDATAPELLRVALHLAGTPGEAEDLVQATFLAAIEGSGTFDATRRVRPWLLGILGMHARRLHRDRQRRPDAARLPVRAHEDPAKRSEQVEFTEAVDAAIDRLPAAYRPVLRLRLRHGMSAVEIAHALARPAGSVRTQILRGMRRLRELLPAAFATLALGLIAPRGLAALRKLVLARAAYRLPPPWLSGAVLMKKLAALALLVALCYVAWRTRLPQETTRPDVQPNAAIQSTLASDTAETPERGIRAAAAAANRSPHEHRTSLVIQLLWEHSAEPATTVGVRLIGLAGNDPFLAARSLASNAKGQVRFDPIAAGRYRLQTDRDTSVRCDVQSGRENRLVLRLAEHADVTGHVVDESGTAVAAADIYLSGTGANLYHGQIVASTSPDGSFRLRSVPGCHFVAARAPGYAPSGRARIQATADGGRRPALRLVLRHPGARLTGRVVSSDGHAVVAARIRLGEHTGFEQPTGNGTWPPALETTSDASGRFDCEGLPRGRHRLLIRARGFAPWYEYIELRTADTSEHVFHLTAGAAVVGRVTAENGEPIAGARVHARGFANLVGHAVTTTDGRFRIDALQTDRLSLRASAMGYEEARFALAPAGTTNTWNPVLRARLTCKGVLRDADGELVDRGLVLFAGGSRPHPRAPTDANGRFVVHGLHTGNDYVVFAGRPSMPAHQPTLFRCAWRGSVRAGSNDLEVRLPRDLRADAQIRLRVTDAAHNPQPNARVRVMRLLAKGAPLPPRPWEPHRALTSGAMRIDGLAPGHYRLFVRDLQRRWPQFHIDVRELRAHERRDLRTVVLPPAGRLVVAVESPTTNALSCEVHALDDSASELVPFENGHAALPLAAGRWRVVVFGKGVVTAERVVTLRAGAATHVTFHLHAGVRRQLVFDPPSGRLPARFEIELRNGAGEITARDSFTEDSFWPHTWWPSLAPGPYTARVRPATGIVWNGRFVIEDLLPRLAPVRVRLH